MSQSPEEIRAEIEATRAELATDVDQLNEKVNPARVVERKVEGAKETVSSVKDKVMGRAHDTANAVTGTASSATSSAGSAASTVGGAVASTPGAAALEAVCSQSIRSAAPVVAEDVAGDAGVQGMAELLAAARPEAVPVRS